jgi:thiosulfate/3-mercaptopyruvate sulfurtransferase
LRDDDGVTSPLLSVAELAALLDSAEPPLILDVQFVLGEPEAGHRLYRRAHVRDAIFCDLDTVLAGPVGPAGGRHPLPRPDRLQEQLRRLGLRASRAVVVYDEGAGMAAARAWWVLRWAGHDNVRILDGGLPAWIAAGQPTAAGDAPAPARGDVTVTPGGMPLLDATAAASLAHDGLLLDARAQARYRGESEPIDPVAGHIPGAVNAPAAESLDDAGRYRSADQLRDRFAELGAGADRAVGAYCGSGLLGAQQVVALTIAGFDAALYAGSWSDWITDPRRPVATGPR